MKRMILRTVAVLMFMLSGCAANKEIAEHIQQKSVEQGNIFSEANDVVPMPGYSMLLIRVTMKTVKEGFYPLESKGALHGKPEYPLVFNIGGQGIVWTAKGTIDTQQKIEKSKRNPEGGEGVKYFLQKSIKLRPGTYRIYLGLTEQKVEKEISITLMEGRASIIEFRPVYHTGRNRSAGESFYEGIRDFEVLLDNKKIDSLKVP